MCMGSSPSPKYSDPYQAEDDHRTLTRAAEIQSDKGRMKGVLKHHQSKKRAMTKLGTMLKGRR